MILNRREDPRTAPKATSVGEGIRHVIAKLGIEARFQEQRVLVVWSEVVGEQIAEVARADAIRNGVLWVSVPHDTWRHYLMLKREDIRDRLNRALGAEVVQSIRLNR